MLVLFPGVKLLRYGIKNTPKSSAAFENELIYIPTPHLCLQWHDMGRPLPLHNEGIINNPNSFTSTNLSENPKGLQDWMCRISKSVGFRQTPRASISTVKNPKHKKNCKECPVRTFVSFEEVEFSRTIQNSSLRSHAATLEFLSVRWITHQSCVKCLGPFEIKQTACSRNRSAPKASVTADTSCVQNWRPTYVQL